MVHIADAAGQGVFNRNHRANSLATGHRAKRILKRLTGQRL
jgi:hypothetical protein